jgi:hypothetical protein
LGNFIEHLWCSHEGVFLTAQDYNAKAAAAYLQNAQAAAALQNAKAAAAGQKARQPERSPSSSRRSTAH